MDKVIQIEVILNYINGLIAKNIANGNNLVADKLNNIRHDIYYGDFNYNMLINKLKEIDKNG